MTKNTVFAKERKCKHGHCSTILRSAWCNSNSKRVNLKLHDRCPNVECNCQKQVTFTLRQFPLKGAGLTNILKKSVKEVTKHGLISQASGDCSSSIHWNGSRRQR